MTRRLDDTFEIVAKKQIPSLGDAAKLERILKQKNPQIVIHYLNR